MDGIRETFYRSLRRELERDGTAQSFLCRYLRGEKDRALADRPWTEEVPQRGDPYLLLQAGFLALDRGEIGEASCLQRVLQVLLKNRKLHPAREVRECLARCAEALGGAEALSGLSRGEELYRRLLELLPAAEGPLLTAGEWHFLREELLRRAVEIDAKAFLYDGDHAGAGGPRKKDRLLEMLDAYCRENPRALRGLLGREAAESALDSAQRQEIEALFQTMRHSDRYQRVFLPVRIDPETGAGLFIVGQKYFSLCGEARRVRPRESCCYVCFYPSDAGLEEDSFSLHCYPETAEGEPLAAICGFPNLEEALSWYEDLRDNEALAWYREVNGPAPPGCPEALLPYFSGGAGRRRKAAPIPVSEEELQRCRTEVGEPQKGEKPWTIG